jgi:hypothetical protein
MWDTRSLTDEQRTMWKRQRECDRRQKFCEQQSKKVTIIGADRIVDAPLNAIRVPSRCVVDELIADDEDEPSTSSSMFERLICVPLIVQTLNAGTHRV